MEENRSLKIYLLDHNLQNSGWKKSLTDSFGEGFQGGIHESKVPEVHDAYNNENAIVFVHSEKRDNWKLKSNKIVCQIVLVRSDGRCKPVESEFPNLHGCHWKPGEFCASGAPNAGHFIKQVLSASRSEEIEWSLLRAPRSPEFFALLLLCDAWNQSQDGQPHLLAGHYTQAPNTFEEWRYSFKGITPHDPLDIASKIGNIDPQTKAGDSEAERISKAIFEAAKDMDTSALKAAVSEFRAHAK